MLTTPKFVQKLLANDAMHPADKWFFEEYGHCMTEEMEAKFKRIFRTSKQVKADKKADDVCRRMVPKF